MLHSRIKRLRTLLCQNDLDAAVLVSPLHLRYYCGFSGSDGVLVVAADRVCFLTDSRYITQAKQQVSADVVEQYGQKIPGIRACLERINVSMVGIESEYVTLDLYQQLQQQAPDIRWNTLAGLSALRQIKDDQELARLEQVARMNAVAFEQVLPQIRPGVSEREIAIELEHVLRRSGGDDKAFDLIVASGERGACPHGVASDKKISSGELVTIDFGACYQGYHSDETVTLAVGEVSDRLRELYETVLAAHDLALAALKPMAAAREIDAVARDHIRDKGYGDFFGHGLGHGVGLEIHEAPTLSPRSDALLLSGMVFTIEPGIYIPDVGGVRIEDTVLMMENGYRLLTQIPKAFRVV
ncbi:MAG: aminopeptidase P family protein [Desulfuromonadaceae bacterium]|nr:aminopeptidase P family protein [Desulfuromonadaceae bacterium]